MVIEVRHSADPQCTAMAALVALVLRHGRSLGYRAGERLMGIVGTKADGTSTAPPGVPTVV
jgi:hypothetical protein